MRTAGFLVAVLCLPVVAQAQQPLTLEIRDFATVPISGLPLGKTNNEMLLSRVNTIREEPGGADRLFVVDMNGPIYIVDKKTRQFTKYLDFDGRDDRPGLFHRFYITTGYGNGINGFVFDPDYRRNGKFYTVHLEHYDMPVSNMPDGKNHPGLNLNGYTTTEPVAVPGPSVGEGVILEWIDTNTKNATFEGTAREVLRTRLNTHGHPQGEIIFSPAARPGDPEWRVLYAEVGDSTSGESRIVAIRNNSQRLDNFVGKILRIIPDLNEHVSTSFVSENGRYRIPNDNPFVKTKGARPEIDKIPMQIGDEITDDVITPKYPVIVYAHDEGGGDAIGSGYLYNGKLIPELRGKYIFGDITTGRFWYADYKEMLALDADGKADTTAKFYPVKFVWDNPNDAPDAGKQTYDSMWPINELVYHQRGGQAERLPARQKVANQGRADARPAVG